MTDVILRRRKLGKTSCNGIVANMRDACVVRNWLDDFPKGGSFLFRWGCTSNVPRGYKVVNTAEAIHLVSNKLEFRRILDDAELCPLTFFTHNDMSIPDNMIVVLRTATHAQGRGLWVYDLSDDTECEDFSDKCRELGEGNYYINEFIPKVAEYRVFVCQGRAVWVAQKTPGNPDDVAWNVAKGGRFDNVRWGAWPLKAVRTSIEAFNLSGLDFGGVDVMVDTEGRCYVLEINSAPSQTSPYRQECVGKAFQYIIDNGREHIPLVDERGGWRKFIHPGVSEQAIIKED